MNSKKKLIILITIICILIAGLGISFSYLVKEYTGSQSQINVADFDVSLLEDIDPITLEYSLPVSDEVGLQNTPVTFKIKSLSSINSTYKVSLVDSSSVVSTLSNSDIRYKLTRVNENTGESVDLGIYNLSADGLLDIGIIEPNHIYSYTLILWLDYDSTAQNKIFSKIVKVESEQHYSLDESGANPPILDENAMIPVYYDQTSDRTGVWRIADKTNIDSNNPWYNYNEFMWANAVTVHNDVRDNYYSYNGPETISEETVSIATNERIVKEDTIYISSNQNIDSSSSTLSLFFEPLSVGQLTFDYSISSEMDDTFMVIVRVDPDDGAQNHDYIVNGGEKSGTYTIDLFPGWDHQIVFMYRKDDAISSGNDCVTISNISITGATVDFVESGDYPWTSDTVEMVVEEKKQMASQTYSYDEASGIFTLTNPTEVAYTSSNIGYYTCNSATETTCKKMYQILELDDNNVVTKVKLHRGSNPIGFANDVGQEVKMDDITTMWVWIPRFNYTIFSPYNSTSEEQQIAVEFENGTETTGSVRCYDSLQTANDSSYSEICTDLETDGNAITVGTSTYTHPAFCFGTKNTDGSCNGEELTGFWMAKFEMATDNCSAIAQGDCNESGLNILVKPSIPTLLYNQISNLFYNSRGMELANNIHGFTQNGETGTVVNSDGTITNDDNNIDIHMQKNMEWGAVTYLAYSQYGKYGNPNYTGTNRRVEKNNIVATYGISKTTRLDHSTVGLSTTGTIYGVYDMNGVNEEYVMGQQINTSGTFYTNSYFSNEPEAQYYDAYSYNDSSDCDQGSVNRGKLGDATKEMTTAYSGSGSWEGSYRYMPYSDCPWFTRSGHSPGLDSEYYFGISYSYSFDGNFSVSDLEVVGGSRPVISPFS